jgi:hypothetical protein
MTSAFVEAKPGLVSRRLGRNNTEFYNNPLLSPSALLVHVVPFSYKYSVRYRQKEQAEHVVTSGLKGI